MLISTSDNMRGPILDLLPAAALYSMQKLEGKNNQSYSHLMKALPGYQTGTDEARKVAHQAASYTERFQSLSCCQQLVLKVSRFFFTHHLIEFCTQPCG